MTVSYTHLDVYKRQGSTFQGPFHVPRSLIMADVLLGDILEG